MKWEGIKESDKNFSIFELEKNQEKIKRIREKIDELIKNNPLIQVDERLKDEKIDEKKCYHYKISLDKNNLDKIVLEFLKIVADENMFGEKESPALSTACW